MINRKILITSLLIIIVILAAIYFFVLKKNPKANEYCNSVMPALENDAKFDSLKISCNSIQGCEWRNLGGRMIGHFSCCPKNLNWSSTQSEINNYPEQIRNICLTIID